MSRSIRTRSIRMPRSRIRERTIPDTISDEGWVECPKCGGLGKHRWRWSSPSATNIPAQSDYLACIECGGRGVIRENLLSDDTVNSLKVDNKTEES